MAAAVRERSAGLAGSAGLAEGVWIGLIIGAFALYYASPWLPLSLVLLACCAALCYLQLPLAVGLVPLAMPFYMLPKHLGHPTPEFSLGETAIVLCCGAFVLRRILEPRAASAGAGALLRRLRSGLTLEAAVALFFLAATAATLAAHYRHFALQEYRVAILEPLAYFALVLALLREPRAMARALWALVGAGVLVALLGLAQYLFRQDTLGGVYYTGTAQLPVRHALHLVTSVYGSPNNVGLLLDRALPVAVVVALAAWLGSGVRDQGSGVRSQGLGMSVAVLAWAAVVVMVVALLLSGSRAGIVGALAVSLIAAFLWWGRRRPRLELAAGAVVLAAAGAVLLKVRHGLSNDTHVNVWLSALHMIRHHPLLGVGPDNFLYYYVNPTYVNLRDPAAVGCPALPALPATHYMSAAAWQEPCLSHPHNVVLDAWLSTGLVGLVALALAVIAFAVLAWRGLRGLPAGPVRAIQVACIAIVVATLGHGLVDNSIFEPDLAVAFWLALGLTANLAAASVVPRREQGAPA